ncbi:MAG: 1-deoxy-D-xylulose-5-phosphate reductoisomerase, partial [Eubacteriales bacterium]
MKRITILGSTGSIGRQTLDIIDNDKNNIQIIALSAYSNIDLLEKQIKKYRPSKVCVMLKEKALELKKRITQDVEILTGIDGLIHIATLSDINIVLTAVVGMIGIRPTIEAIKAGKDIAIANKETLVTAGSIIMPLVKEKGVSLLPVDSEHSAIFQCLNGENKEEVDEIILTASGGPFRGRTLNQLKEVNIEDALNHPNWSMGSKITIDSASMMNKGLEIIEAKWLFDLEPERIKVVVHPESIIHSMVSYIDGSVMAQSGLPDMRLPIQYALYYPRRKRSNFKKLDLIEINQLTFEKPDLETFVCLKLAYDALKIGGTMPTVLNAANEWAVSKFLNRYITFLDIPKLIEYAMGKHTIIKKPTLKDILDGVDNYINQDD